MRSTLAGVAFITISICCMFWMRYERMHRPPPIPKVHKVYKGTCQDSISYVDSNRKDFACAAGTYIQHVERGWIYCECLDHDHIDD